MSGHFSALLALAEQPAPGIPVTVLTGFLGSGKTSLLNRLLALPDLRDTAIIVNEFGATGIDQALVSFASEDTVLLANGCLCCSVRGDLVGALERLAQRAEGAPRRVLIETSGLADPGPILRSFLGEPTVRARYFLAGVACTVDAILAEATLSAYPEARRQLAVADLVLMTKTDLLAGAPVPAQLMAQVRSLNSGAPLSVDPASHVDLLLQLMSASPGAIDAGAQAPAYRAVQQAPDAAAVGVHREGISSFVLVRDQPLPTQAFGEWMDMVMAMRGDDLLRVKGIVHLLESPQQPLVIHGVQHLFAPPQRLPCWPRQERPRQERPGQEGPRQARPGLEDDRRTRIVFITRGLDAQALDETLSVLVRRHGRRARGDGAAPTISQKQGDRA